MTADNAFEARTVSASEYVRGLFDPADNIAILVRNRAMHRTVQRIAKAETVASPEFQVWLASQNAGGSDVFVGMNPIKDGAHSRTKGNIKDIRHIYLDLDREGDASLHAIRNSTEVPAPNFVLNTSPGKHQVVWKVNGASQDEAETLLRALANKFDGDLAATDSTRVLRLPGFANRKLSEEFIVQARQETNAVYTARDFAIQNDAPETPRHLDHGESSSRAVPSGHKSQSEQDWAYAKRALARGDDPEEVIQRVADYRSDDKANPDYYARHTVQKAQAELHAGQTNLRRSDTEVADGNAISHEK